MDLTVDDSGQSVLRTSPIADKRLGRRLERFDRTYQDFFDQIDELEDAVHDELGTG